MKTEYIDRNGLLEALNKFAPEHYNALVNLLITKYPAVDVAEVVRCKDCKESFITRDGKLRCECLYPALSWVEPDDFCSYGERKEGA